MMIVVEADVKLLDFGVHTAWRKALDTGTGNDSVELSPPARYAPWSFSTMMP